MGFIVKAVKSVVKAVVGVVSKVVGGVFGFLVGGKKTAAVAKAVNTLNKSLDPEAFKKIVLGRIAAPLDVRYWEVYGPNAARFDEVIALAGHRINAALELYMESDIAIDAAGNPQGKYAGGTLSRDVRLGAPGQTAMAVGGGGQWTATSTFDGVPHILLRWLPDEKKLPNGIPSRYTQVVEGALVYDPRRDSTVPGGAGPHRVNDRTTWEYATLDGNGVPIGRNNALQTLWYLLGWTVPTKDANGNVTGEALVCGRGVDPEDINLATFIAGANNCEIAGYYTDMVLSTEDTHTANEDKITCSGLIGRLIDPGGLWSYYANVNDTANIAVELTDADIIQGQSVTWNEFEGMADQFNQVTGKYINPSPLTLFQAFPYPMVRDATYEANLGVKRRKPQDFEQVLDGTLAQRLARLFLNQGQYQGEFGAAFNYRAVKAQAWSVVRYTSERFGFVKLFRVWRHDIDTFQGVSMLLKEIDPSIWSAGTVNPPLAPGLGTAYQANQEIPLVGLAVANVTISGQGTNTNVYDGGNITWTEPSIAVRRTEVRYRVVGTTYWETAAAVERGTATNALIYPLVKGTHYQVQARHVSIHEVEGPWNDYPDFLSGTAGNVDYQGILTSGITAQWPYVGDPNGTRPENNATVGAPVGTNVAGVPAQTLVGNVNLNTAALSAQGLQISDIITDVSDLQNAYGDTASAAASASAALAAQSAAQTARDQAQGARDAAQAAQAAALGYAGNADGSRAAAAASAAGSLAAQGAAETARNQAQTFAGNADGSATAAAGSASNAQTSAINAGNASSAASASSVSAQSVANSLLPERASLTSNFTHEYEGTNGKPELVAPISGFTIANVAGEGDVVQFDYLTSFLTRGWLAVGTDRIFTAEAKIRVTNAPIATVTNKPGFFVFNANGVFLGTNQWAGDPVQQAVGVWNVFSRSVTSAGIIAQYPTAAYIKASVDSGRRADNPAFNSGGSWQVSYLRLRDVTSENNAALSATAAATSASSAATSATNAGQQASAAQTSALNASTSAGQASTSAGNAASSESNAAGSASSASTSANNAATARTQAEGFSNNAANSASAASGSASNASASASAAGQSATSAQGFATNAQTSAGQASTSAGQASTSATNASGSASSAAASQSLAASAANSAQSVANRLIPNRPAIAADFTYEYERGNPNLVFDIDGSVVNVAGEGDVRQFVGLQHIMPKGWLAVGQNRVFKATARQRVVANGAFANAAQAPGLFFYNSSGSTVVGAFNWTVDTAMDVNTGWLNLSYQIRSEDILYVYPNAAYVKPITSNGRIAQTAQSSGATWQISYFVFEDITDQYYASQSATAAANSASSAAASNTAAGQQASAAQTSATNAQTSAGQASTSASAASTSASNAAGSANSAGISATAAANSNTAAGQQASAAAGSASAASTSASNAAQSATSAQTSATNASTSAGQASTSAGQASQSATNAAGSASSASTSSSVAASAASAAQGVANVTLPDRPAARNNFSLDYDAGFPNSTPAYLIPTDDNSIVRSIAGEGDALELNGQNGPNFCTRGWLAIETGQIYRAENRARILSGSGDLVVSSPAFFVYNASGAFIGTRNWVVANPQTAEAGFISRSFTESGDVIRSVYPTAAFIRAATTVRMNNANLDLPINGRTWQYSVLRLRNVTSEVAASGSASAAATSASNAAASNTAAGQQASSSQQSATNANTSAGQASTFAGQASTSASNAAGSASQASASQILSASAAISAQTAANIALPDRPAIRSNFYTAYYNGLRPEQITDTITHGSIVVATGEGQVLQTTGMSPDGSLLNRGWLSVGIGQSFTVSSRVRIVQDAANLSSYRPALFIYNADGASIGTMNWTAGDFLTTANGWVDREYVTTSTEILSYYPTAAFIRGATDARVNGGNHAGVWQLSYLRLRNTTTEASLASATASVASNSSAIATLQGRSLAYWQQVVNAGAAGAFVEVRAESVYGAGASSNVSIGAREIHLYNQAATGAYSRALSVAGGRVTVFGDLDVGGAMRFGTRRIPVALQSFTVNATDGQTISFGGDLTNIPKVEPQISGLPALASGKSYDVKALSLTSTGYVTRAKIVTQGTPSSQNTGAGVDAGNVNPKYRAHKPSAGDAVDGSYNFFVSGQVQLYVYGGYQQQYYYDDGGGNTANIYVDCYVKRNGAWQAIGSLYTSVSTFGYGGSGMQTFYWDASAAVYFADTIGQDAGGDYEFGIDVSSDAGNISSVSFGGVTYQAQGTQTAEDPIPQAITFRIVPQNG